VKYIIIIGAVLISAVMLFLLAIAGDDTDFFERKYQLLIQLNIGFVLFLMTVVGYLIWRLRRRLKKGVLGSRLALRLLLIFSLMAVLPGILVYSASVQFLGKSIESWFDVKVDQALESGLNLGRTTLDNLLEELRKNAQVTAITLSGQSALPLPELNQLLEQSQVQEATLFNKDGRVIAFSDSAGMEVPEMPSTAVMRQVRMQEAYSAVEFIPGRGLYLRVVEPVPVNILNLEGDIRILQLLQPVPKQLAEDAKRLYGVTLTLVLLLSLFSALAAAFLISERLSAPLGMLAEGTRAVAQGDFSRRHPVQSNDELGVLTESFNLMTHQLEEARTEAQRNQHEVESARAYLESILANLSSGVLVFDESLRMRTANLSAEYILKVPLASLEGLTMEECTIQEPQLLALENGIREGFQSGKTGEWQCQVERTSDGINQVLLLRGTRLPHVSGGGGVVIFDDITNLLQAQRTAAWREVARRLAHEIKNPLTPIQLSAERVQHKLAKKLNPQDSEILKKSTETIVNQVAALKTMVNEFSEYAREPELKLHLLDLNKLIQEVLTLYETTSIAEGGELHSRIHLDLTPNLPPVKGDSTRLRQVIHNLLQNAQDTLVDISEPVITVSTKMAQDGVCLSLSDNGKGFPDHVRMRAFEPYVTTKLKGTGLGLPIVKKIVEEHNGTIQIENIQPHGARIAITLPTVTEDNSTITHEIT
jgi:nitrogen fixation/metabolism regulation signal transduction histidine kinase